MESTLSLADIQRHLDESQNLDGVAEFMVHILRNVTVEAFVPYLRFELEKSGMNAKVRMGEYGQILNQAVAPGDSSSLRDRSDCVFVFMNLKSMAPDLVLDFSGRTQEAVNQEVLAIQGQIDLTLSGIRNQTDAILCWMGFERPIHPPFGVLEDQGRVGLTCVVDTLNSYLKQRLLLAGNAFFVDLNRLVGLLGASQFYDMRFWYIARAPYSRKAQQIIAQECSKIIRSCKGKTKKCLILDCDNTLWGGVIGEDGLQGIALGNSYPGVCFKEFQKAILNLYHRGVVLALCSKNNPEDVLNVFKDHPDTVLREEHFAAIQVNWVDKATNIQQIATELNLGVESFVFVDDSEFETNLIRKALPEVSVLCLAGKAPSEFVTLLYAPGYFDQLTFSSEDRGRGQLYKQELQRKNLKETSVSMEEYLHSLGMFLEVKRADSSFIPRVSQLTQRTNQFNLSTKRYTESEVQALVESKDNVVFTASLKDRFGDAGTIGTCILRFSGEESAEIDSFLLSCRVLGRGVESALLMSILSYCREKKCQKVIGYYKETQKNIQVKHFYEDHEFKLVESGSMENVCTYHKIFDQENVSQNKFYGEVRFIG